MQISSFKGCLCELKKAGVSVCLPSAQRKKLEFQEGDVMFKFSMQDFNEINYYAKCNIQQTT